MTFEPIPGVTDFAPLPAVLRDQSQTARRLSAMDLLRSDATRNLIACIEAERAENARIGVEDSDGLRTLEHCAATTLLRIARSL